MLETLLPGFAGTVLPSWLRERLRAGLGGVCLFAQNISSPAQLRALTDSIMADNPDAIIAVDEEGGDVTRLYAAAGAPFPGNAVLGRLDDVGTTRDTAGAIGWSLRQAGCTVNFAPCVDINSRSDNPVIGVRSFGSDAERVARHGAAWVAGLQSTGVAATAKHFPGHGDTAQDSHVSLPVVSRSLDELRRRGELLPFGAAIDAGSRLIMTSHILLPQLDPEHPATMSRIVLDDLLRGELGFSGVVVSDALDMAGASGAVGRARAAVAALRAGCDLLCLGTENTDAQLADIEQEVRRAVAEGSLASDRLSNAASRVLAQELRAARLAAGQPPNLAPGWRPGREAELAHTFDLQPGSLDWRTRASGRYAVVRLEAEPNIAVGSTPWGPAVSTYVISPEQSSLPSFQPNQPVLVVGRDIHQHPFAREAVDRLRSADVDVLIVDMGWPSDDRRYADVATFGASPLMGRALLAWLRM